jgi:hypothetical protein
MFQCSSLQQQKGFKWNESRNQAIRLRLLRAETHAIPIASTPQKLSSRQKRASMLAGQLECNTVRTSVKQHDLYKEIGWVGLFYSHQSAHMN